MNQDSSINPWLIAMTVMLATFMEVLDTSVANVALPHIAGTLAATVDETVWLLTSYLVPNAVVLPLSGFFSTLAGRNRFYMACVFVFTLSSLLCGMAPNLQAIVVASFPLRKRGIAMAANRSAGLDSDLSRLPFWLARSTPAW